MNKKHTMRSNKYSRIQWQKIIPFLVFISLVFISCDKEDRPTNEEIVSQKIDDIIPKQYQDSLLKYGLELNKGANPPNIEGTYHINPLILSASNIQGDREGMTFASPTFKAYDQSQDDYSIKLLGRYLLTMQDTSIATAISGEGDKFTIYGKIKSVTGDKYAQFGIVFTGEKNRDNSDLKNIKYGIINIDNSHGGGLFIEEGKVRIGYDSDQLSEAVDDIFEDNSQLRETGQTKKTIGILGH